MKKIKKNLKWITVIIVMIVILGFGVIKWYLSSNKSEPVLVEETDIELKEDSLELEEEEVDQLANVFVDIKGAIKNPGVYEIAEDKKVIDVVGLAGGFTEQADTSMVNLAKKVANEMVIIIYTIEEVKKAQENNEIAKVVDKQCICPKITNDACLNNSNNSNNDSQEQNTGNNSNDKVNINSAALEELMTLSGIGESKAEAIIEYRETNGNFEKIEDLMEVTGIGEALYEKIKDNITV